MKLVRFSYANDVHVGLMVEEDVLDLGVSDPIELIGAVKASGLSEYEYLNLHYDLAQIPRLSFKELNACGTEPAHILMPLLPPEIWACGVTYVRSRAARESETAAKGIYDRVYDALRPEIFFKATLHRCVGPNEHVWIRQDSTWTVPEPELVVVLGSERQVLGFTAGNDLSARDIEAENPLYLPQAKIYQASCSLGPALVTPSSIGDLEDLTVKLSVKRNGSIAYQGETKTGLMKRKIPELIEFLTRDNPVPSGSVCMTGTGIVPPDEFALANNDLVEISIDNIGVLRNPVRQLEIR